MTIAMTNEFATMRYLLVPCIVDIEARELGMDERDALRSFYASHVNSLLEDERTALWHLGAHALASMFLEELETGSPPSHTRCSHEMRARQPSSPGSPPSRPRSLMKPKPETRLEASPNASAIRKESSRSSTRSRIEDDPFRPRYKIIMHEGNVLAGNEPLRKADTRG